MASLLSLGFCGFEEVRNRDGLARYGARILIVRQLQNGLRVVLFEQHVEFGECLGDVLPHLADSLVLQEFVQGADALDALHLGHGAGRTCRPFVVRLDKANFFFVFLELFIGIACLVTKNHDRLLHLVHHLLTVSVVAIGKVPLEHVELILRHFLRRDHLLNEIGELLERILLVLEVELQGFDRVHPSIGFHQLERHCAQKPIHRRKHQNDGEDADRVDQGGEDVGDRRSGGCRKWGENRQNHQQPQAVHDLLSKAHVAELDVFHGVDSFRVLGCCF